MKNTFILFGLILLCTTLLYKKDNKKEAIPQDKNYVQLNNSSILLENTPVVIIKRD